ncbi:MAG: glutathione S-transferase family protein [Alphaproteobacteria bacterium]|nr:glutathione S-transferase family protein [Alphaproteobacteria bacterium]
MVRRKPGDEAPVYRLFWDRGSANMAPHAVLREIGCPFELIRVDISRAENRDPDYLALNPNARVPTLVDGDRVIYESAAIMMHLCEAYPQAGLMPLPGEADRGAFLQWLFWFTNTLQEDLQHWWHADNYLDTEAARHEMKVVSERRLARMFSQLDSRLGEAGPYMLGERFSALDIFLAMLCRWTRAMAVPATSYLNLNRLIGLVTARPAWQAMMLAEGIDWNGPLAS